MEKIYPYIYLFVCLIIIVVLVMILKEFSKSLPKLQSMASTSKHMQENLNNMNDKVEYINSVKEKVATPSRINFLAKLVLAKKIFEDYDNSKNKSLIKSIKKIVK